MAAMSPARAHSAFTLIEILASLLLFALGVMAVVGVVMYGQRWAARAQSDATAWATAWSVLKDPMPLGCVSNRTDGRLALWTWTRSGSTWTAKDASGQEAWACTAWRLDQAGDQLIPDMADPRANNPAVFPANVPASGCARGWLNGYYVERREQSRASDRLGQSTRMVEVRVDVYWAGYGPGEDRPLASLVDRVVRQGGLP